MNCVVCASTLASVYCCQDKAFLCPSCDKTIHDANIISRAHKRLPVCELCKRSAAAVYCNEDQAALCTGCEREVHSANPLPHTCVPIEQAMANGLVGCGCAPVSAPAAKAVAPEEDETSSAVGENGISSSGLNSLAVVPDAGVQVPAPSASANKDAKGLWGKEFEAFDFEAAWLGNLGDFGLDFSDILAGEDAPGMVPTVPTVPVVPTPAPAASNLALAPVVPSTDDVLQSLAEEEFPMVPSFLQDFEETGLPSVGSKRAADAYPEQQPHAQHIKVEHVPNFVLAPPPPPYIPSHAAPVQPAVKVSQEVRPTSYSMLNGANLTREQRVARWREKRKNRTFQKTIRYASRKAYAEVRPRIKGRFATKEEVEAYKARQAAGIVGPEDHLMIFS